MFFMFRCLFWLGLVFSNIAAQEGLDAAAFARQTARAARQQAAGLGPSGIGQTVLDAAGKQCAATPEKCLALTAQAAWLTQDTPAASRDSLSAGDRVPAWRLRTGKSPESGGDAGKHD